MAEGVHGFDLS